MAEERGRLRWRKRLSLRLRITLITAVAVAVVVAVGGVLILVALRAELVDAADDAVRERAEEVAVLAADGALPNPLPVMKDPETFAEVWSNGRLVTATDGLDEQNRFDLPEQTAEQTGVVGVPRLGLPGPGPYRVVSSRVDTPTGPMTVHVAISVAHLEHTMTVAAETVAIGVSLLVAVLGTVLWVAIGRALAPVDAIRARADAITGQNLGSRVPVPERHDEIGRLAHTVNEMLGRLQHSAESQQRFVADAAHELRSPIASLRVQLETARDGATGRESDMLHETERMEGLVDQLLLLAHADADTAWVRSSTVDLDDIVDSAVSSLGPDGPVAIDASGVEPVQLFGDPHLLEQVVLNLLHNALRHANEVVRVSVSVDGDVAVLMVDDDGPGVPEDRREDTFGRFVRLDDSRARDRGGVGLGLAIVAEIVRAHGGRVAVSDSPAGGARFVVKLPIAAAGDSATTFPKG